MRHVLKVGHLHLTPKLRAGGVDGYSVRLLKARSRTVVRIRPDTESAFRKISDPANAHLFSAEAALEAFADVPI